MGALHSSKYRLPTPQTSDLGDETRYLFGVGIAPVTGRLCHKLVAS